MRPQARSWKPGANTEHRGMRATGPGATQPPRAFLPFQMDPVQKAVISHTFGVPTPLKKKQFISCNICHLRFNSAVSRHGAGPERGAGRASGAGASTLQPPRGRAGARCTPWACCSHPPPSPAVSPLGLAWRALDASAGTALPQLAALLGATRGKLPLASSHSPTGMQSGLVGVPLAHTSQDKGTTQRSSSLPLSLALRSPWLMLPVAG